MIFIHYDQVQQTFYCIDYKKARNPNHPQTTPINMTRKIIKFIDVIEDSREIVFSELSKFYYFEPRLMFKNCPDEDFFLKSHDKIDDFSDFIWAPLFAADVYSSIEFHTFGKAQAVSNKLYPVGYSNSF